MSKIQYTIRGIPPEVDQVMRKRARVSGASFNQTVVDALNQQVFGSTLPPKNSLEQFFGAGKGLVNKQFDEAIAEQSKIDETIWR